MKYHSKLNLSKLQEKVKERKHNSLVCFGTLLDLILSYGTFQICLKKGPTHLSKMHDFFGEKQIILQMSELGNAALLFLGIFLRAIKVACQANFLKLSIHYFLVFVDLE